MPLVVQSHGHSPFSLCFGGVIIADPFLSLNVEITQFLEMARPSSWPMRREVSGHNSEIMKQSSAHDSFLSLNR